jgi:hypothetical protein
MKNIEPNPPPAWTVEQLIEALNRMRDAWMSASMELRDIQFDMDSVQRQDANDRAQDLVNKVKPH